MFYSHEILTSRQYGVATVWLVATIGPRSATSRRVNRKAILEVDVPKACDTILDPPGAPIALRLQANLLYGVARVYQEQCGYVLTDAGKTQEHMRRFEAAILGGGGLDLSAGKAKRDQLILQDDPDFDLNMEFPVFNLEDFVLDESQRSAKTSSQLSPLDRGSIGSLSSSRNSLLGGLQIPRSSSMASPHLDLPLMGAGLSGQKQQEPMMGFGDDEDMVLGDFGLIIDDEGNIIEELDLPAYPQDMQGGANLGMPEAAGAAAQPGQGIVPLDDGGDFLAGLGEEALPEAEPLPARQQPQAGEARASAQQDVAAPLQKTKRGRPAKVVTADGQTTISRTMWKDWNANYLANMEDARLKSRHHVVSRAQAQRNAANLTFGLGIADIGLPVGLGGTSHPLADEFAGHGLQARLLGVVLNSGRSLVLPRATRRRSSAEAFDGDGEEEDGRRVRPRLDDGEEAARAQQDGQGSMALFADDIPAIEVGRDPGIPLSDQPSIPWNRPGSSALRDSAQGSARKSRHLDVSPLVGRGSALPDIERFSDNAAPAFGSDAFQPLHSQGHSSLDHGLWGDEGGPEAPLAVAAAAEESQAMRDALDREGRNFVDFVERVAAEKGKVRDGNADRRWVDFEDLFEAGDNNRAVAAQAFYHVLSLATKGALFVEQDGENKTPFGAIRVGVTMKAPMHDGDDHGEGFADDEGGESTEGDEGDEASQGGESSQGDDGSEGEVFYTDSDGERGEEMDVDNA